MKLANVLSTVVNQTEKTKFLNFLDDVCAIRVSQNQEFKNVMGDIKASSNAEIVELFNTVHEDYKQALKAKISMESANIDLLINILIRDGNSVATINWIEQLYEQEVLKIDEDAKVINKLIQEYSPKKDDFRVKSLVVYYKCFHEAFFNDTYSNREAKISSDERSILNLLAKELSITEDERIAIEHLVDEIPRFDIVPESLETLRTMGVLFHVRRTNTIYVPNEIIEILREIEGIDISDKYLLRILRSLSDPELSSILRTYGKVFRGVDRQNKIKTILSMRLDVNNILSNDIFVEDVSLNARKDRLKLIIDELDITVERLGSTVNDRIEIIVDSLKTREAYEVDRLSISSFEDMFLELNKLYPDLKQRVQNEFEIEPSEIREINIEVLYDLSITPYDVLYLFSNDEIKDICSNLDLGKRNVNRETIIKNYIEVVDKLIDNYELLASRDLNALNEKGIKISEADLGIRFEEATKEIFRQMGLNVDEETRKLNNAKNKADLILSRGNNDIIICELKTFKNGEYAKYSTTSRQILSYVEHYMANDKNVASALIIAPGFTDDFIGSAQVEIKANISLLTAAGLMKIYKAFKAKKKSKFSSSFFTKSGLLPVDLIIKNI